METFALSTYDTLFTLLLAGSWAALLVWSVTSRFRLSPGIPKYGSGLPFFKTWNAIRFMTNGREILRESYAKHAMFWVPRLDGWFLIVRGSFAEEIRRAPQSVLSLGAAVKEQLQIPYTLGSSISSDPWHEEVVRHKLVNSRTLEALFPDVQEEIFAAIKDELGDSRTFTAVPTIMRLISRVSNRVFVGPELCRNPEWQKLNIDYTIEVGMVAMFINLFPSFLHSFVGRFVSLFSRKQQLGRQLVGPLINERMSMKTEEMPQDMLSWLIQGAPSHELNVNDLTRRVLTLNFAAIHTTSISLTHAFYWLLARPEYQESLRHEIQEMTERFGWTKEAMEHMVKLDSFIKESLRMNPLSAEILTRKTVRPFTFSNGVTVPAGTNISTHLYGLHRDETIYANATQFDGNRFVSRKKRIGTQDDADYDFSKGGRGRSMVVTSSRYMPFGHGRLACPGRFLAANELKSILAVLLTQYDLSWSESQLKKAPISEKTGTAWYRPDDMWIGATCLPNQEAEVTVRRRPKC